MTRTTAGPARVATLVLTMTLMLQGAARAGDLSTVSGASAAASAASVASLTTAGSVVVEGSIATLGLSGQAVVASVEAIGSGTIVVLHGVSQAGTVVVRIAGDASLVAGSIVEVVALGTGVALMAAGKIVAFIPNQVGQALVRHRPVASVR